MKAHRGAALTLALGSLLAAAALSWQPLALLVDTLMHWPNIAIGLFSPLALVAGVALACVMLTSVASGRDPASTRHFTIAQCVLASVIAAVSLVMFYAAGLRREMSPQEYLTDNLASSWSLPLLLYVPLALSLVSLAAMRFPSR
jgi:uncharacterized membrane protein YidH (DUF202 family)